MYSRFDQGESYINERFYRRISRCSTDFPAIFLASVYCAAIRLTKLLGQCLATSLSGMAFISSVSWKTKYAHMMDGQEDEEWTAG